MQMKQSYFHKWSGCLLSQCVCQNNYNVVFKTAVYPFTETGGSVSFYATLEQIKA